VGYDSEIEVEIEPIFGSVWAEFMDVFIQVTILGSTI
jgi:hypothetical protein